MADSSVGPINRRRQASVQALGRRILHAGWKIRVHGSENIPHSGPVIVAANHLGWLDGPVLLTSTRRPLRVLAKHELWRGKFGPLLRAGGAIPIDWRSPDRTALQVARSALANGEAVGIFPEGTRCRGDFAWLRDGVSYLLTFQQVPVVPVAIFGTRLTGRDREHIVRLRSEIHVVVGEPLDVRALTGDHSVFAETTKRSSSRVIGVELRKALADHVASAAAEHGLSLPDDDVSRREDHLR